MGFFAGSRPGRSVTHGQATFELPILYFRDDLFLLFFTADIARLKALMPSDRMQASQRSPFVRTVSRERGSPRLELCVPEGGVRVAVGDHPEVLPEATMASWGLRAGSGEAR